MAKKSKNKKTQPVKKVAKSAKNKAVAKKTAPKKALPKKKTTPVKKAVSQQKKTISTKVTPAKKTVAVAKTSKPEVKNSPAKTKNNTIAKPIAPIVNSTEEFKPLKVTVKSGPKKPEPKGKYVMEFSVRSSPHILFEFISTPSGLSEWFADNVNVQTGGFFTFFWDGVGQQSKLIGYRDQVMVRFEWLDKKDGSYFEFRIQTDELTSDVSLIITDFADPAELQTSKLVWESQVDNLLHLIGSFSG